MNKSNQTEHSAPAESDPEVPQDIPIVRPPKRALTGCVFILPLALLLGLLGQELRTLLQPPAPQVSSGERTPAVIENVATPTRPPTAHGATPQPAAARQEYVIYVPDADAMLHKRVVSKDEKPIAPPTDTAAFAAWYQKHALRALTILLKESNSIFPPGTTVPTVELRGDTVNVDFKPGFETAHAWDSEKIAQLAVYSVVNTLSDASLNPDGKQRKVQLLVGGKPRDVLGELDISTPLDPNRELVAPS
jgi:hypothetical protein